MPPDNLTRTRTAIDVAELTGRLEAHYGEPVKKRRDPLDELVLTILSQSTSDTNRDRAWAALRRSFDDWEAVRDAEAARLEATIRVAGLAGQKTATIQGVLRKLSDAYGRPTLEALHGMEDAEALDFLSSFRGVGQKTAACVLCFALGRPVLPVDTHVHRLARRLALVPERATAVQTQAALNELVPSELRFALHIHLIRHGRAVCKARQPRCGECVVEGLCDKVGVSGA
jgi:endonuclease-3